MRIAWAITSLYGPAAAPTPRRYSGTGRSFSCGYSSVCGRRFEDRDRAVADVVVELLHGPGDDPVGLVPRPALGQHRLAHAGQEERVEQARVRLVGEQVAVVVAVGGQDRAEGQVGDRLRLGHVAERGRAGRVQVVGLRPRASGPGPPTGAPRRGRGGRRRPRPAPAGTSDRAGRRRSSGNRAAPPGGPVRRGRGGRRPSCAVRGDAVANPHQNSVPDARLGSRALRP